jgi:AraC-like DNA-binding protein
MLVKQVAEETGFADPFHFSRVFKSIPGLSPDIFRRMRERKMKRGDLILKNVADGDFPLQVHWFRVRQSNLLIAP